MATITEHFTITKAKLTVDDGEGRALIRISLRSPVPDYDNKKMGTINEAAVEQLQAFVESRFPGVSVTIEPPTHGKQAREIEEPEPEEPAEAGPSTPTIPEPTPEKPTPTPEPTPTPTEPPGQAKDKEKKK